MPVLPPERYSYAAFGSQIVSVQPPESCKVIAVAANQSQLSTNKNKLSVFLFVTLFYYLDEHHHTLIIII